MQFQRKPTQVLNWRARALARANDAKIWQKGCAMQLNGISLIRCVRTVTRGCLALFQNKNKVIVFPYRQ